MGELIEQLQDQPDYLPVHLVDEWGDEAEVRRVERGLAWVVVKP